MINHSDLFYLHQALELAKIRRGFCSPDPATGAIIVLEDKIVSSGFHFAPGLPSAELDALSKAEQKVFGGTLYLTLEPSFNEQSQQSIDAIMQAGIKRVVYGHKDPNPSLNGKGIAVLFSAGIRCEFLPLPDIEIFYRSYNFWFSTKKPFLTAQVSLSLDGRLTETNPKEKIIGEPLEEFSQTCRKNSDAILTNGDTILQNDPNFKAVEDNQDFAKPIFILDQHLKLKESANIFQTAKSITLFYDNSNNPELLKNLKNLGVRCIPLNLDNQEFNLEEIINFLGKEGFHDVWIEGGGKTFGDFANKNLLQKGFIYISPQVLAQGLEAFQQHVNFKDAQIQWQQVGLDVLCEVQWR